MIQKLILPPDPDGYSFLDGLETLSAQLDGGASRYRSDILNANIRLNVQWTLTPTTYNYIRAFYKVVTQRGALPFLVDLYIDNPFELTEHEAHFVPGTFGLKMQRGQAFVVGATLEVKPLPDNQTNIDAGLLYGLFGEEYNQFNDILDNLINVEIPSDYP